MCGKCGKAKKPRGADKRRSVMLQRIVVAGAFCGLLAGVACAQCIDIPTLYQNLPTLLGDTICIKGDFTTAHDSMLVTLYQLWLREEPMPPHTKAKLLGVIPTGEAECGGFVELEAVVAFDETLDAGDTLALLVVLSYRLILPGICDVETTSLRRGTGEGKTGCDSCKFAIIVSGGEKMRHWKKLLMMYRHKLADGYCASNIYALYGWDGTSREPDSLSSAALLPCDPSHIRQAHQQIAHKVAECHRAGKPAKVQKLFDEHGGKDGSIFVWDDLVQRRVWLHPETLLALQQMIIDSSSDTVPLLIEDEFVECYGGSTATVIARGLRLKGRTVVRGNANAGRRVPAYAQNKHPWDRFLHAKITALESGTPYDKAVAEALRSYREKLLDFIEKKHDILEWYRAMLECMNAGTSAVCSVSYHGSWYWDQNTAANRAYYRAKIDSLVADSTKEMEAYTQSGVTFKKKVLSSYCETLLVVVPPGDQIEVSFPDSARNRLNCGNITVWEDTASSPPPHKWVRRKIWNWNNRGSHGFSEGNDRRVLNAPPDRMGVYKIHCDDHYGGFTIEVITRREHLFPESPSNYYAYANASFGWRNGSADEFNHDIIADYWFVDNAGLEGFSLEQMPAVICPRGGGTAVLDVAFGEMGTNDFWRDTELWFVASAVFVPGTLSISVEGAEFPYHRLYIEEPGEYIVHLGDMTGFGRRLSVTPFVNFSSDPVTGPSFEWDCWALRTIYDPSVGIEGEDVAKPKELALSPNYPDPFNERTTLQLALPQRAQVRVEIVDILGRVVAVPLAGGSYEAGTHTLTIDMTGFESGIYFIRASAGGTCAVERVFLLR